jgi:hypothetical protein
MYIPKRYGESRIDSCPFCGRQALIKNSQGIAVCTNHKDKKLDNMKCMCGENLLMQEGKFGVFFNCFKCGNINLRRALEINSDRISRNINIQKETKPNNNNNNTIKTNNNKDKRETTIQTVRSDDPRYFRY